MRWLVLSTLMITGCAAKRAPVVCRWQGARWDASTVTLQGPERGARLGTVREGASVVTTGAAVSTADGLVYRGTWNSPELELQAQVNLSREPAAVLADAHRVTVGGVALPGARVLVLEGTPEQVLLALPTPMRAWQEALPRAFDGRCEALTFTAQAFSSDSTERQLHRAGFSHVEPGWATRTDAEVRAVPGGEFIATLAKGTAVSIVEARGAEVRVAFAQAQTVWGGWVAREVLVQDTSPEALRSTPASAQPSESRAPMVTCDTDVALFSDAGGEERVGTARRGLRLSFIGPSKTGLFAVRLVDGFFEQGPAPFFTRQDPARCTSVESTQ